MQATIAKTREEYDAAGEVPGLIFPWRYAEKGNESGHIIMRCPGCGHESGMHVRSESVPHPPNDQPSWIIAGYPDSITLAPSINCTGCCGWHGYLKNGNFEKC